MNLLLSFFKNPKILLSAAGLIIILSIAGYIKFQDFKLSKLETTVTELNESLRLAHSNLSIVRNSMSDIAKLNQKNIEILSEQVDSRLKILDEVKKDLEVFEKHNLEQLANKKSGLIELRANKATEKIFTQIEEDTERFLRENQ